MSVDDGRTPEKGYLDAQGAAVDGDTDASSAPAPDDITIQENLTAERLYDRGTETKFLVVIYGDELGKRHVIENKELRIGRGIDNEIQLLDHAVSRLHSIVKPTSFGVLLEDAGSKNHTFVNDRPITAQPLRDGDVIRIGRSIFKYLSGENVESAFHEEIYHLMTTDALTGAFNRRSFDKELKRTFSQAQRYKRPFCMLMLDIDHFKRVNDTYGHLFGDYVLAHLGRVILAVKRDGDIFCRYGGEEFALLMPEASMEEAVGVAERFREAIAESKIEFEGTPTPITVSIGVSSLEAGMTGGQQLCEKADERLYLAKKGGRDRVEPSPGSPEEAS